jgi:hypothetical protein
MVDVDALCRPTLDAIFRLSFECLPPGYRCAPYLRLTKVATTKARTCRRLRSWAPGAARLTASARLVISGDTGMAHLAAACARPSVTLFGPVPPAEWGPPAHPRHQMLWRATADYRGDPHSTRTDPALAGISVDAVLAAADRALGSPPQGIAPAAAGSGSRAAHVT